MALGHKDGRRSRRRAFVPAMDGRIELETRVLLSATSIRSQTAAGGQAVVITSTNGLQFFVSVTEGTIQGYPAPGGRVSFVVNGTTSDTEMEINQIIPKHSPVSGAHTFNSTLSGNDILNIASINVTSGSIGDIEGYHTAVLSGPISAGGTTPVNRIALLAILPGGSIGVGGDLDTLDIFNSANFTESSGLYVGRDLNWFEVGGDLSFTDGANMVVGRGIGQIFQVAKGSGNAGQGLYVNGNLTIGTDDVIAVGTNLGPYGVLINGEFSGATRFVVAGLPVTEFPISPYTLQPYFFSFHGSVSP